MKKMNNKGFSLVELIVVIAIMAVLVGVLAPQFIKYVESSRRSTDVSNAQNIQSAILADIAEATWSGSTTGSGAITDSYKPTTLGEAPVIKGNKGSLNGQNFVAEWDKNAGTCKVYAGVYDLTTDSGVAQYKDTEND